MHKSRAGGGSKLHSKVEVIDSHTTGTECNLPCRGRNRGLLLGIRVGSLGVVATLWGLAAAVAPRAIGLTGPVVATLGRGWRSMPS